MKKVLIPNGSFHDIPLIKQLKKMGYYVIASGKNPNQAGYQFVDKYIQGDFSVKEKIFEIARNEQVDQICSNCNDFGYITSCYVAEKMGFVGHDSYDTALKLHRKDEFKIWAQDHGMMTPSARIYRNQNDAVSEVDSFVYPVIVKPVDLGAGQGVCKVNNPNEAIIAIKDAFNKSKSKGIVVEKYVVGTAHSFNAFIVNQKVVAYYSDNEYMKYDPYRVSTSASPADYAEITDSILVMQTELVSEGMKLSDGLVHSQYILDENHVPHILEITRRMSGDWYPYPEMKSTNVDWVYWIVASELGLDCSLFPKSTQKGFTGRHALNGTKPGVVVDVQLSNELKKHVYDSVYWFKDGKYIINDIKKDYPGIIFFEFNDRESMMKILDNIDEHINLIYKE